jgi:hypothetical protein
MSTITPDLPLHGRLGVRTRLLRGRRKKFLILAVTSLAVLATALGVAFTADTGVSTLSISAGPTSHFVYMAGSSLPANITGTASTAGSAWKFGTASAPTTAVSPSFVPSPGNAGTVTTHGDVAFIDARTANTNASNLILNVYIANLGALVKNYSSFAWPLELYTGTVSNGAVTWSAPSTATYLTDTSGVVSFDVTTGANTVYELALTQIGDTPAGGGSFFALGTAGANGSYGPQFYVTSDEASG